MNEFSQTALEYKVILQSLIDGLYTIDTNGFVTFINTSALELLGLRREDAVGHPCTTLCEISDGKNTLAPELHPTYEVLQTRVPISSDAYTFTTHDNRSIPVSVSISPMIVDDQRVGVVCVFRDIAKEREIDEMKTNFISLASHQLRTPATGVKFYLSMLRDGYAGEVGEKQRSFIDQAYYSNERQLGVLNDLLDVAHIESGKYELQKTPVDVNEMVQKSISDHQSFIQTNNHTVVFNKNSDSILAQLDSAKVRMVVDNFVSNAIKYTPSGGTITLEVRDSIDTFYISITDTGVGISSEDISKLFQKFSRVDNPLSTKVGGSGLGLYIAKKLVELHNGTIEVHSELGKGTTFTIILPKGG